MYVCMFVWGGGCGGGNNSAAVFKRAIIMPNLKPPVTTVAAAVSYRERILKVLPSDSDFEPLMTLYLTDATTKDEIQRARKSGLVKAVKLYPAGATTNSQAGVTDLFGKCMPVLEEMVKQGLPLLVKFLFWTVFCVWDNLSQSAEKKCKSWY
jgi:dihydroorotase